MYRNTFRVISDCDIEVTYLVVRLTCCDINYFNNKNPSYLLGGQGHRIKFGVRWQAWIYLSPMRRTKDSESVSGIGLRGGSVEDEVDCCSAVQDAELTVPRPGAARRTAKPGYTVVYLFVYPVYIRVY